MKIFWAWQSDTHSKTGRHFVRAALLAAIEVLKQPPDIEEPTQAENRESMHLDQDRQGITGSPGLVDAIKKKIVASEVVVADITPVSRIPKQRGVTDSREKRNMNPDVAIELGYALHALGGTRVLLVLNECYGGREFIPFDLQHLGGPIIYNLAPFASKEDIEAEHRKLLGQLVTALRGFLTDQVAAPAELPFPSVPATTSAAVWFEPGEVLAELDDQTRYGFEDDKGIYLKVSPRTPLPRPFTTDDLYERARQGQLGQLYHQQTGIIHRNVHGAILLEPVSGHGGRLHAATQVFRNGEIWAIGRDLLVDNDYGRLIPYRLLRGAMRQALTRNLDFMQSRLRISPPYKIDFGAVGIEGYSLKLDDNIDNPYQARDNELSNTFVMADVTPAAIDSALLRISNAFFKITGYPRPHNV